MSSAMQVTEVTPTLEPAQLVGELSQQLLAGTEENDTSRMHVNNNNNNSNNLAEPAGPAESAEPRATQELFPQLPTPRVTRSSRAPLAPPSPRVTTHALRDVPAWPTTLDEDGVRNASRVITHALHDVPASPTILDKNGVRNVPDTPSKRPRNGDSSDEEDEDIQDKPSNESSNNRYNYDRSIYNRTNYANHLQGARPGSRFHVLDFASPNRRVAESTDDSTSSMRPQPSGDVVWKYTSKPPTEIPNINTWHTTYRDTFRVPADIGTQPLSDDGCLVDNVSVLCCLNPSNFTISRVLVDAGNLWLSATVERVWPGVEADASGDRLEFVTVDARKVLGLKTNPVPREWFLVFVA